MRSRGYDVEGGKRTYLAITHGAKYHVATGFVTGFDDPGERNDSVEQSIFRWKDKALELWIAGELLQWDPLLGFRRTIAHELAHSLNQPHQPRPSILSVDYSATPRSLSNSDLGGIPARFLRASYPYMSAHVEMEPACVDRYRSRFGVQLTALAVEGTGDALSLSNAAYLQHLTSEAWGWVMARLDEVPSSPEDPTGAEDPNSTEKPWWKFWASEAPPPTLRDYRQLHLLHQGMPGNVLEVPGNLRIDLTPANADGDKSVIAAGIQIRINTVRFGRSEHDPGQLLYEVPRGALQVVFVAGEPEPGESLWYHQPHRMVVLNTTVLDRSKREAYLLQLAHLMLHALSDWKGVEAAPSPILSPEMMTSHQWTYDHPPLAEHRLSNEALLHLKGLPNWME